jgi:mono/diheme cytochrome c family protein
MNTNKQINIMILLVFGAVILTGAYWLIDPDRADSARDKQLEATIDRGAWLFSQNCRTCHGDKGEGGAASNRLRAAPPLNRPDLQGIKDGEKDSAALKQAYDLVFNTITCGRVGRAMPTWGQSQGGTLNEEQIKQLTVFITEGTGWDIAEEYAIHGVPEFDLHSSETADALRLAAPIGEGDTTLTLNSGISTIKPVEAVSQGIRLEIDDELMVVQDVNADSGVITVERGIGTTDPAAHDEGADVLKPPVPPDPAPVTEQACGQTASAQPTAGAEAPSAQLSIIAKGIAWSKTTLSGLPDVPLTLTVDNQDNGIPHNIAFTQGAEPGGDPVARTEIQTGPVTETLNFGPLAAGEYYYYCEVHPNMEGVLTVAASGAAGAPPAGATEPAAPAGEGEGGPTPAGAAVTPSNETPEPAGTPTPAA